MRFTSSINRFTETYCRVVYQPKLYYVEQTSTNNNIISRLNPPHIYPDESHSHHHLNHILPLNLSSDLYSHLTSNQSHLNLSHTPRFTYISHQVSLSHLTSSHNISPPHQPVVPHFTSHSSSHVIQANILIQ